ncbi:MAG: low molecular weight phosphotyrosine protein phosphatase [Gemmatimonadetes bacterium]|nr:low molecular weight phosphotyrosine protein phosphatase [Gemmatimonadota bacterium]
MSDAPIRVLFVCLGNICRSPTAEGVFRHVVTAAGLAARFDIDSAGTGSWHVGEPPDARAAAAAQRRGIRLSGRARQLRREDLRTFHYVLAMDAENLRTIERLRDAAASAQIRLFREFDPAAGDGLDVPDPYYGGPDGFETVLDIVERAALGLLEHIRREHAL